MRFVRIGVVGLLFVSLAWARAGEVGFVEDFALAKDRTKALDQLIPGTEDYYYYHCLHLQHQGKLKEVEALLAPWIKRHGHTSRVEEMRNRQALLLYKTDPDAALAFLRQRLQLTFHHAPEQLDAKPTHPTKLDPRKISYAAFLQRALTRYRNSVKGVSDAGLYALLDQRLDKYQLRDLLRRISRPDHPKLVKLIAQDLANKHSRGFGSLQIHRALTKTQLESLRRLRPDLQHNQAFIHAYLQRLQPAADVDWRHDAQARQAYLDRLWDAVKDLAPTQNSLKAHVLYQRLVHDRQLGIYDKKRFMAYIQLPRHLHYVNPEFLKTQAARRYPCNLKADFRRATLLPPIHTDEPLVRSFLEQYFLEEDDIKPYVPYIREAYLKQVLAETKVLNGLGDMERWASMLSPAHFKALKERVEINFAPTNKTFFRAADPVSIAVDIKNVRTMIVKVFEVNTANYYRESKTGDTNDINLDGLVANEEKTYTYEEPPLRRVRRTFEFPQLQKGGLYFVEFIGNGRSNRVLIRKGQLRFLERQSTAGQILTVLDTNNKVLPTARVWLAGHEYKADEKGEVLIPFSTKPGNQAIVLQHGDFAFRDNFHHRGETYALQAGIYVDREALLKRQKAVVLVRPRLLVNGIPVTLSLLEDVVLSVTVEDQEGINTTKEVRDFKLYEDRESTHEFAVPEGIASIDFTLRASVQPQSRPEKVQLQAAKSFILNMIDKTEEIAALHLKRLPQGYVLELLGKTGEPLAHRPVHVYFKHHAFTDRIDAMLQTDKQGRIELGALEDIHSIFASPMKGRGETWTLTPEACTYQHRVHGKAAQPLRIPYMGTAKRVTREAFSLLETRAGVFYEDRFQALSLKDGFLEIAALPAGMYELYLREARKTIDIHLSDGQEENGWILGENRLLEVRNAQPLQIASTEVRRDEIRVQLAHATKFARVHVFATRFVPAYSAYADLSSLSMPEPSSVGVPKSDSVYLAGRDIGDEYRYILERKYATTFPGNMLPRPSLLLNPWAVRQTDTGTDTGADGGRFGHRSGGGRRNVIARGGGSRRTTHAGGLFANLDFLATPSAVLVNLRADEKGIVTVKRSDLGANQLLTIVAADPQNTVLRRVILPEKAQPPQDLRLSLGLDPDKHYTEQKEITPLTAGQTFTVQDITTSQIQTYDTLAKVYGLYMSLSGNTQLAEFAFVLNWPTLKPEEKQEKYSKYACHELHMFLSKKDPQFFKSVVQPYLKNKKDKTFMDHYLLNDELTPYLDPWRFGQLNIAEQALLAQRLMKQGPSIQRHVTDLYNLIPPDIERFNHLFQTAIRGQALDTDDGLGLTEAKEQAKAEMRARKDKGGIAPALRIKNLRKMPRAPGKPQTAAAPKPTLAGVPEKKTRALAKRDRAELEEADADVPAEGEIGFFVDETALRDRARRFYRKLEKTQEWAENNYYHVLRRDQVASLVSVNAFWRDVANHKDGPFLSRNLAEASNSFTEMMLALAMLDLPFEAEKHKSAFQQTEMSLTPASAMVVYHKEIKEAPAAPEKTPILVSQNFFRLGDRYRYVDNEKLDKFVTDEFLVHVVYGCQVVVTNPTSSRQKLDALLQIPRGALPVKRGFYTRGVHLVLEPYGTRTFEYHFYFPQAGTYKHYPVHIAKNEKLIAAAAAQPLKVVETPTNIDKEAWDYVSQHGEPQAVLAFLKQQNLGRVDLSRVAWRLKDKNTFQQILQILRNRRVYDNTLWSYGLYHKDTAIAREYLEHQTDLLNQCGPCIDTDLIKIDPVLRGTYEHLEYSPLVNARAHMFGRRRKILNARLYEQYHHLLDVLAHRPALDDVDRLAVTYYLLLQDRIAEALAMLAQVQPDRLATRIQYDYLKAYVSFFTDKPGEARAIAERYKDHPVPRWRQRFLEVLNQLDEIEGKNAAVIDPKDRTQTQTRLAATEPSFDFKVEAKKLSISYQNLTQVQVNYYLMDVELLFSRNPFVQQYTGQFAFVRPNQTQTLALSPRRTDMSFDLPKALLNANVMVEVVGGPQRRSQAYYSNQLNLQLTPNYGQLRVLEQQTAKPLSKVYVKVYARTRDGQVKFYKDGYTDLRGRFDYASLSTNEIDFVERFSILVLSETAGAEIREVAPPKQ